MSRAPPSPVLRTPSPPLGERDGVRGVRLDSKAVWNKPRTLFGMPAVIQLEDFSKTYHQGDVEVRAVRHVSLEIQPGEFVAIMGASGSGKSTMMNALGCLDRPSSGLYRLDGVDVGKLNRDELADLRNQKIGFVFQGFNLLSRTSAIENIELPMLYRGGMKTADRHKRAVEVLTAVGLDN